MLYAAEGQFWGAVPIPGGCRRRPQPGQPAPPAEAGRSPLGSSHEESSWCSWRPLEWRARADGGDIGPELPHTKPPPLPSSSGVGRSSARKAHRDRPDPSRQPRASVALFIYLYRPRPSSRASWSLVRRDYPSAAHTRAPLVCARMPHNIGNRDISRERLRPESCTSEH